MAKTWKQFEEDVYRFVAALGDKKAEVIFNHKIPDKDTGTSRQVDVWINAKLLNHYPLSVVISCKNIQRKLDVGHIEKFYSEIRSVGASTGVIYSSSGFTKTALKKATTFGLACCRLYRNEPSDIPSPIKFPSYLVYPHLILRFLKSQEQILQPLDLILWKDLFELKRRDDTKTSLIECLTEKFNILQAEHSRYHLKTTNNLQKLPPDIILDFDFLPHNLDVRITIRLSGIWKTYCSDIEAHYLNGSYCLSSKSFHGNIATPCIDTHSNHPGNWWHETNYDDIEKFSFFMLMPRVNVGKALIDIFANREIE